MSVIVHTDIKRTEVKLIKGDKWRFSFRENGFVIIEKYIEMDKTATWQTYLNAPNVESALEYAYQSYGSKVEPLRYEELQDG